MNVVTSGDTIDLMVTVQTGDGQVVDPATGVELSIARDDGSPVLGPIDSTVADDGVTNPAAGTYAYSWAVPAAQPAGVYLATWTAEVQPGVTSTSVETFAVLAPAAGDTAWTTPAQVFTVTGVTADPGEIAQAQSIIDVVTGVGLLPWEAVADRNRRYLAMAVAYQVAWARDQVDLYGRAEVSSMTQEGGSFSVRDGMALLLAPLARRALARCSWNDARNKRIPGRRPLIIDPTVSDDHRWYR